MRTIVYVDGFNMYYGCVRNTPYKWLDLSSLVSKLLRSDNEVVAIKYFTATVSARPNDPDQATRQATYFRALKTIPNLEIILGHFLSHTVKMPLANGTGSSEVIKTEEKGSDVNLATHLLMDGFENKFDLAVLITNDSDFLEPVRVVKSRLKKKVGIINPHRYPSRVLQAEATFLKSIRRSALANSQFPETITDSKGTIRKPNRW